jgi:hypothetical protein
VIHLTAFCPPCDSPTSLPPLTHHLDITPPMLLRTDSDSSTPPHRIPTFLHSPNCYHTLIKDQTCQTHHTQSHSCIHPIVKIRLVNPIIHNRIPAFTQLSRSDLSTHHTQSHSCIHKLKIRSLSPHHIPAYTQLLHRTLQIRLVKPSIH